MKTEASLEAFFKLLDMPDDMAWGLWGVDEAQAMYLQLSEDDMHRMRKEWRDWPFNRVDHLAAVMGAKSTEAEMALARDLRLSAPSTIASRAQDAIGEIEADIRMKTGDIQ